MASSTEKIQEAAKQKRDVDGDTIPLLRKDNSSDVIPVLPPLVITEEDDSAAVEPEDKLDEILDSLDNALEIENVNFVDDEDSVCSSFDNLQIKEPAYDDVPDSVNRVLVQVYSKLLNSTKFTMEKFSMYLKSSPDEECVLVVKVEKHKEKICMRHSNNIMQINVGNDKKYALSTNDSELMCIFLRLIILDHLELIEMCQMLQGLDRSRTFTTMCEDNEIFWMNEADKSLLVFTVCGGEGEMTIKIQYGYMEEDVESTFVVISYPYVMAY